MEQHEVGTKNRKPGKKKLEFFETCKDFAFLRFIFPIFPAVTAFLSIYNQKHIINVFKCNCLGHADI